MLSDVAYYLNADLTALYKYGQPWNVIFAPAKTSSLVVSLKSDVSSHPPLFLNNIQIPEVNSKCSDLLLTLLSYRQCFELWTTMFRSVISLPIIFECQDNFTLYKSWISPMLEYGSILYSFVSCKSFGQPAILY